MTLSNDNDRADYDGDGSTTSFPTLFKFEINSEVMVVLRSASGVETTWVENTDYTLTGAGVDAGGTVVATVAPASGTHLSIVRDVPLTQETAFPIGGAFNTQDAEDAFDRVYMALQQISEVIKRSVRLAVTSVFSELTMPDPESGRFLRWRSDLTGVENADITGQGAIGLPVSIADGGTNATTAAAARANLGATATGDALVTAASAAAARGTLDVYGRAEAEAMTGGFKNKIIGGDFSLNPWNRGTSFVTAVTGAYTANQWLYGKSGAMVHDVSKSADAPTVAQAGVLTGHSLLVDCTTADTSVTGSDIAYVETRIEGYNWAALAQRAFTLSFWIKATRTGTYCVAFYNNVDRSYVAEYTVNQADTWELKTITVSASPSAGTWDYTTGLGLRVMFMLAAASGMHTTPGAWQTGSLFSTANAVNACDSAANDFRLALVQLEAGSIATDFETRSVAQELALCQRYLPVVSGASGPVGAGFCNSATKAFISAPFDGPARIAPTGITVSNGAHFLVAITGTTIATTSLVFNTASVRATDFEVNVAAGLTAGQGAILRLNNTAAQILFTGAEL